MDRLLKLITPAQLPRRTNSAIDPDALVTATAIVEAVRQGGAPVVRRYCQQFQELDDEAPLFLDRGRLHDAFESLPSEQQDLLVRMAGRIDAFARAQARCLAPLTVANDGVAAGHTLAPVASAGCYAPGGRFPLPSSVLMTAVTARAAGVPRIVVASPRPTPVTLAAAAVAGADQFLCAGGAQAIAALSFGIEGLAPVDIVVGPGNRYVTAAKHLVSAHVGIDMLAGPSELLVLADGHADPALIAADLLAQAEHDDDAVPMLVTTEALLLDAVERELQRQLQELPTADTARAALSNGLAVLCESMDQALEVCNQLAPEHLQLHVEAADSLKDQLDHYGALFLGALSAEVLGDYGAGPNHVLPTGRTARHQGGLSVFTFLRVRTWLRIEDRTSVRDLAQDAADMARLEGLIGHERAARFRL